MSMIDQPCTLRGCPGRYEAKVVNQLYTVDGHPVVIEGVPAEVCSLCGDTLLAAEASRGIEVAIQHVREGRVTRTAPVVAFQAPAA